VCVCVLAAVVTNQCVITSCSYAFEMLYWYIFFIAGKYSNVTAGCKIVYNSF